MIKRRKQFFEDMVFVVLSVVVAYSIVQTGIAQSFVASFSNYPLLGVLFSGMLFTSVFTTSTSIALLGTFSHTVDLIPLALVGGLGAALGDYVLFRFLKDRIAEDFNYLFSHAKRNRFFAIFKTHLFKLFVPFLGALVIASPFPDEIGIAMLGMSKMKNRSFMLLSLCLNTVGVFLIGYVAKNVIGR